jgi:predicted RNase H-related nuclease YkuK (DUF458 family)
VVIIKSSEYLPVEDTLLFQNSSSKNLTFEQVYKQIIKFISQAPYHEYRLSIGSDSQVGRHTVFVTAIHIHRIGRGAIGFITKQVLPRPIHSLREKIYYETSRTIEIASLFTPQKIEGILDSFLNYQGSHGDICFEFHLDVGTAGATKDLIAEMVAMASSTMFEPKIKPESYTASCYADRYTKDSAIRIVSKSRDL